MKAIKKIKEVAHKAKKLVEPEPVKAKAVEKKLPENGQGLCTCTHFADKHYGPHKNWCNESGCACQEFKVKES